MTRSRALNGKQITVSTYDKIHKSIKPQNIVTTNDHFLEQHPQFQSDCDMKKEEPDPVLPSACSISSPEIYSGKHKCSIFILHVLGRSGGSHVLHSCLLKFSFTSSDHLVHNLPALHKHEGWHCLHCPFLCNSLQNKGVISIISLQ